MTTSEIVNKLIGKIRPVGESNTDAERLENLKQLCVLTDILVGQIDAVRNDFKESHESSVKEVAKYAYNFIEELKSNLQ